MMKKWKLDKPSSATWDEWDEWKDFNEARYPIRYFLQETLPMWIRVHITMRINNWYWSLQHRFNPRHQYNIIRTSLKPGYYDPDTLILYACMDNLKRFFEYKVPLIEWQSDEGHKKAYDTMKEIYDWWINEFPYVEDNFTSFPELPEEWGFMAVLSDKYKDEPLIAEWRAAAAKQRTEEKEAKEKEQEMLHKLIDIRHYLWY